MNDTTSTSRSHAIAKIFAGVVVLTLLVVAGRRLGAEIPAFIDWVDGLGVWGPVVFVAGYAIATVAFIPGSALTLAAGAVFGVARGTALAFTGAMIGATGAFLIARYVARARVEAKMADSPRFRAIDRAVGVDGRRIVVLLRLSPIFPFNLLNYALGLTSVRLLDYVIASLAMLPGTVLYVYYGKVAGEVVQATAGASSRSVTDWIALGVGLAATIAVTAIITSKARRALRAAELEVGDDEK